MGTQYVLEFLAKFLNGSTPLYKYSFYRLISVILVTNRTYQNSGFLSIQHAIDKTVMECVMYSKGIHSTHSWSATVGVFSDVADKSKDAFICRYSILFANVSRPVVTWAHELTDCS